MTQTNMTTNWQRNVRCTSNTDTTNATDSTDITNNTTDTTNTTNIADTSGGGKWEWKDEHGKWTLYPPGVCRLLDACRICGVEEWEITAGGRMYRVELGEGSQGWGQVNVATGVRREVRCGGVGGATSGATAEMGGPDTGQGASGKHIWWL